MVTLASVDIPETSTAGRAAASAVVAALDAHGLTVATAESLTGGQVAAALTAVPGASAVYVGGVVAYATELKVRLLGVPETVVQRDGVISEACALAMADGIRRLTGADLGVATTGVAGPARQEGHPAGTVFVAVARQGGREVRRLALEGDRAAVQRQTVDEVLRLVHGMLRGEEPRVR